MARTLPRQKLSGPRFGFTTFTGAVADLRDQAGLEPLMTQFGWPWETQIMSLGWLTGYRLANGLELGVGPNFSVNKQFEKITTSMVVAGGSTLSFGDMYVPLNLAVALAKGGPRITILTGWIIG